MSAAHRIEHLRRAFPEAGLFRDKEWRLAAEPFALDAATLALIESLGPALRAFQRACNRLYFASLESPTLAWVAGLLDQGKPAELIALGRHARWRDALPGVLRPDLVLTPDGVCITELDSLPGGIGLTGWLNDSVFADPNRVGDSMAWVVGVSAPLAMLLLWLARSHYLRLQRPAGAA